MNRLPTSLPGTAVRVALAAIATPVAAQITTDRPDFVESASTVGAGVIPFESEWRLGSPPDEPVPDHLLDAQGVSDRPQQEVFSDLGRAES